MKNYLDKFIINNEFSGCAVGLVAMKKKGAVTKVLCCGRTTGEEDSESVDRKTFFDLASLTKPLVVSLCLMVLEQQKQLSLDAALSTYFSRGSSDVKKIKLYSLLNHSSGLPAHKPYYEKLIFLPQNERWEYIEQQILNTELKYKEGTDTVYSDLGYLLLGRVIERVSGITLDRFWTETILKPLQLQEGLFYTKNKPQSALSFSSTGRCTWSKKEITGVVHDDNCRSLGGVAGHAGTFGTITAMLSFVEFLIRLYHGDCEHPYLSSQFFKEKIDLLIFKRRYGFDTPTGCSPSCGSNFSNLTIGHLGYTGTSFWIDLINKKGVVLLTNRTYYKDDLSAIRKLRPEIHNMITSSCHIKKVPIS